MSALKGLGSAFEGPRAWEWILGGLPHILSLEAGAEGIFNFRPQIAFKPRVLVLARSGGSSLLSVVVGPMCYAGQSLFVTREGEPVPPDTFLPFEFFSSDNFVHSIGFRPGTVVRAADEMHLTLQATRAEGVAQAVEVMATVIGEVLE
jgi:hypothetical protein